MANLQYTTGVPSSGTFTRIDHPIKKNAASTDSFVTYIDLIRFGQTSNFGYNHNGAYPISPTAFNNWPDALEAIHAYLDNINKRLEALENGSGDEPDEPTYTVTCNVSNGSKSPNSTQTIESGGSVSWTITPNSGYQMPTSVTGATINGNRVTVSNVISDKIINVNCAAIPVQTYTVTCNVYNGSKSPNNTQTIESGGSVSWTITPNSGYQMPTSVTGATINGNRVTVSNVISDRAINVTCVQSQPQTTYYIYAGMTLPNANNLTSISTTSFTAKPTTWQNNPYSVAITNNTNEDAYFYYCFPVEWNVVIYDEDKTTEMSLWHVSTFTLNGVEYTVDRMGRQQGPGATQNLYAKC